MDLFPHFRGSNLLQLQKKKIISQKRKNRENMIVSNVESIPAIILEAHSQQCLLLFIIYLFNGKLILKVKVIKYSVVNVH